jgi:hypothetical protein
MDIDTNDQFVKARHTRDGISYLQPQTCQSLKHASRKGSRTPIMTRNPGDRYHNKEMQCNAHGMVLLRRGLARGERPDESEATACAD